MLKKFEIIQRLKEAEIEHAELKTAINNFIINGKHNHIEIQRLKKNKLKLKDEIKTLRSGLIPDNIA